MSKRTSFEAGQELLQSMGFDGLWAEVFHPGSPLAFLTAQGLRVAAPVLGAFTTAAGLTALESLAARLEEPPAPDPDLTADDDEP